jgi:Leucine Rich repeat
MQTEPPKADPPKRKRRRFQFSLRTLSVFVTGAAIICGWYAAKIHHAADEDALIDAAQKIEGRVEVAYSGPDWMSFIYPRRLRRHVIGVSFDLSSGDCRQEDLRLCLAGFPELQWLDLGRIPLDEEGLRYVGRMDQLSRLIMTDSSLTESGAAQLARLPKLQELNLSGCQIDNSAIRRLADCPHLQKLMLRRAVLADELVDLGHVHGLSLLDLAGCEFSLSFAANEAPKISNWLTGLDTLEELYLRDCRIQPADIESISRLKNLRIVDLSGCTISPSDLRRLLNLPRLKQLGLAPKSIDDETIQVLHKHGQLELLSLDRGDYLRLDENSPPGFLETRLPMLQRAFPSIQFDTRMPEYPRMRCYSGQRVIDVPELIGDKANGTSAGGGTF